MEVKLKSNWQEVEVELLKTLYGYKFKSENKKIGYVDYIAKDVGDNHKLLRVIVDPKHRASNAFVKTVDDTLDQIENKNYSRVTLVAKSFSSASKRLVKKANTLEMISLSQIPNSTTKVIQANQSKVDTLCMMKCGFLPTVKEDCNGYENGEYSCEIRRISDDSDFHAKMGWLQMLKNDFSRLIEFKKKHMDAN
jgi:hypothetical protein